MTDWNDGFLARWLFVLPEGEPDFDATTGLFAHGDRVTSLSYKLMEIERNQQTDFIFAGDAHQLWDTWQRRSAKDAYYFGDDILSAIVTRYSAYALKFSMILAAVNDSWGTITPAIMQTAIHLADNYKVYANRLLSEKKNYGISGGKLQKVFAVIKGKNKDNAGVVTKTIQQYANMNKSELDPCLEKLVEIGAVVEEPAGKGKRYKPATDVLPIKTWR